MTLPSQVFSSRLRRIALVYGPFAHVYSSNLSDLQGVAATNNFVTLMNPSDSLRTVVGVDVWLQTYTTGVTSVAASMRMHRITDATAGTLVPNAAIFKFDPAQPDSVTVARTDNPSVTGLGAEVVSAPPPIALGGANTGVASFDYTAGPGRFMIPPGNGIVLQTSAGDVDQRWNIHVTWIEFDLNT